MAAYDTLLLPKSHRLHALHSVTVLLYGPIVFSVHSIQQEYVLWNAVSVQLLQFARYCSIVQTLSLKYPGRDLDLEVT